MKVEGLRFWKRFPLPTQISWRHLRKAAEGSVYEAPTRNGKPVKVEFYLPVRFSMLK